MDTSCVYFFNGGAIIGSEKGMLVNENIRAKEVLVIGPDPDGKKLGVRSLQDALTLAEYSGYDLVLIGANANPPVCKMMDYNKYMYEKKVKQKEAKKKQRQNNLELKEYRLSPVIDQHDFDTRLKNAGKYLQKGHRVKVNIRFKGRQMAHTEIGRDVLLRFASELEEFAEIETKPKLDGRNMTMLLKPKK